MQLLPYKSLASISALQAPHYKLNYTTSITSTTNNTRLAASNTDKYIYLYDQSTYTLREKFPTKPSDKDITVQYSITCIQFDPTNTKLAVCQSDHIIYVYKLGDTWGEKKSICNKFVTASIVIQCIWLHKKLYDIIYICNDNSVRIGNCKTNKSTILYSIPDTNINCISLTPCITGPYSGHSFLTLLGNGSIYKYIFQSNQYNAREQCNTPILLTTVQPHTIHSILYTDQHIILLNSINNIITIIHSITGETIQAIQLNTIQCSTDQSIIDCSYISIHPSGKILLLASYNQINLFQLSSSNTYNYISSVQLLNLYSVTSMCWNTAGSHITISNCTGAIDTYEINLKKLKLKYGISVNYTSLSSILITQDNHNENENNQQLQLNMASSSNSDIHSVTVHNKSYIVALTSNELLVGNLLNNLQSCVPYDFTAFNTQQYNSIRYNFNNDNVVMFYVNGELYIVQLGDNQVVTSIHTEHYNTHLLSVREQLTNNTIHKNKLLLLAYVLDLYTIRIIDVYSSKPVSTITSTVPLDWLTLNHTATKLLYRTTSNILYVYDVQLQQQVLLLSNVSYVQCIPDSDVCVVQSLSTCYIYYNTSSIHTMNDTVVKHSIDNGEICDIIATGQQTNIVIEHSSTGHTTHIKLDHNLILFNTINESTDLYYAANLLESLTTNGSKQINLATMWLNIATIAYKQYLFDICIRAYIALDDQSKVQYMQYLSTLYQRSNSDKSHYTIQIALAIYEKQYKRAELLFIQYNMIHECIHMYITVLQWDTALTLAQQYSTTSIHNQLQQQYLQYLVSTNQYAVAAGVEEKSNHIPHAIELYLQGNYFANACQLLVKHKIMSNDKLFVGVLDVLNKHDCYELMGDLYMSVNQVQSAYDIYLHGNIYVKAIELARQHYGSAVVELNERYGDYLLHDTQYELALQYYIQAHRYIKAMNICIEYNMIDHAINLLPNLESAQQTQYSKSIAQYYQQQQNWDQSELYYVQAGEIDQLVQMYIQSQQWSRVYKLTTEHSTQIDMSHINTLISTQINKLIDSKQYQHAELAYTELHQYDQCIQMYRQAKQYDQFMKYMQQYKHDEVDGALVYIGNEYKRDKNYKSAEQQYITCKRVDLACTMYFELKQYDDCVRLCKLDNTQLQCIIPQFINNNTISINELIRLLVRHKLFDICIDQLLSSTQYDTAVLIIQSLNSPDRLSVVYSRIGEQCENHGEYSTAEQYFLLANKPSECIDMYLHQHMYDQAIQIAQQYQPDKLQLIQHRSAQYHHSNMNYTQAELMYVAAGQYDQAIQMYRDNNQTDDALRLAQKYNPSLMNELQGGNSSNNNNPMHQPQYNIHSRANSAAGSNNTSNYQVNSVKQLQNDVAQLVMQKQYESAIDRMITYEPNTNDDNSTLCDLYQYCIQLTNQYTHGRLHNVTLAIVNKLQQSGQVELAGTLLVTSELYNDAIELYIKYDKYDLARGIAKQECPGMLTYVDTKYQQYLLSTNNHGELSTVNPSVAIELAVKQGNWNEVYRIAIQFNQQSKYAAIQCAALIKDNKLIHALNILTQYGIECNTNNFIVYERLASDLFASKLMDNNTNVLNELKNMLKLLCHELHELDSDSIHTQQFTTLYNLTCYTLLYDTLKQQSPPTPPINELCMKLSITLLRYTQVIPVDKAYYNAGLSCSLLSDHSNDTFIYWNRYIDICDRIVDHSNIYDIDNTEFQSSDLPRLTDIPLPNKLYYSDDSVNDDVREYILNHAMSSHKSIKQLSHTQCIQCHQSMVASNMQCNVCEHRYQQCIVSGMPLIQSASIHHCTACNQPADRHAWNIYVKLFQQCPVCMTPAQPSY